MAGHIFISFLLLIAVSYTDLRERRIPNKLLLVASIIHILIDLFDGEGSRINYLNPLILVSGVMCILCFDGIRNSLRKAIGAGDIKLILYLSSFLLPFIDFEDFFLGLGLLSLLSTPYIFRGRSGKMGSRSTSWKSNLPFAPYLLGASSVALLI